MTTRLESLREQLSVAVETLHKLEIKAAQIPSLERGVALDNEIDQQKKLIEKLKLEIAHEIANSNTGAAIPEKMGIEPTEKGETSLVGKSANNDRFLFTNRREELDFLLAEHAATYSLIDGPAGYGKTELLLKVKQKFEEKKWLCAYVCVKIGDTIEDVAESLSDALKISDWFEKYKELPPGFRLGSALLGGLNSDQVKVTKGIILLVDFDKKPSLEIVLAMIEEVIPSLNQSLRSKQIFKSESARFRVIYAGRNLAPRPEIRKAPIAIKRLSPFDDTVIKEYVRTCLKGKSSEEIDTLAAHFFYFTGGHPVCIVSIMKLYSENHHAADPFIAFQGSEIWRRVGKIVNEVRAGVFENMQQLPKIKDRLGILRYLDYYVLDKFIEYSGEEGKISEYDLADELTETYLMDWKDRVLRDDISRRLLSIGLRQEAPAIFRERCREAMQICSEHLTQNNVQKPERWVVEYLFQSIQQYGPILGVNNYHDRVKSDFPNIMNPQDREKIRGKFFTTDLPHILNLFLTSRDVKNFVSEQRALEQELEGDWEFRFLINYFLRKDYFDDEPSRELGQKIDLFFAEHQTGGGNAH